MQSNEIRAYSKSNDCSVNSSLNPDSKTAPGRTGITLGPTSSFFELRALKNQHSDFLILFIGLSRFVNNNLSSDRDTLNMFLEKKSKKK